MKIFVLKKIVRNKHTLDIDFSSSTNPACIDMIKRALKKGYDKKGEAKILSNK